MTTTTATAITTATAGRPSANSGPTDARVRLIRPSGVSPRACPARHTPAAHPTVLVGGGPVDRYHRSHHPSRRTGERVRSTTSRRPNYAARRAAVLLAAVLVVLSGAAAVSGLAATFGGAPASAAEASPSNDSAAPTRHVAQPGDTLWSIAAAHRGSVPHDRFLDALIRLNGGTEIQVGQAVRLP